MTYGYDGLTDLASVVELSVRTVNQITAGLEDVYLTVHLCHAHGGKYRVSPGADELIMGAVSRMRVDRVSMEFNSPVAQGMQQLEDFPDDKLLGLGVIDPKAPDVESPEQVVQRAEHGLEFVSKERLVLNPDCGFATTARGSSDVDGAYLKLSAMCQGAGMLRDVYG